MTKNLSVSLIDPCPGGAKYSLNGCLSQEDVRFHFLAPYKQSLDEVIEWFRTSPSWSEYLKTKTIRLHYHGMRFNIGFKKVWYLGLVPVLKPIDDPDADWDAPNAYSDEVDPDADWDRT